MWFQALPISHLLLFLLGIPLTHTSHCLQGPGPMPDAGIRPNPLHLSVVCCSVFYYITCPNLHSFQCFSSRRIYVRGYCRHILTIRSIATHLFSHCFGYQESHIKIRDNNWNAHLTFQYSDFFSLCPCAFSCSQFTNVLYLKILEVIFIGRLHENDRVRSSLHLGWQVYVEVGLTLVPKPSHL